MPSTLRIRTQSRNSRNHPTIGRAIFQNTEKTHHGAKGLNLAAAITGAPTAFGRLAR